MRILENLKFILLPSYWPRQFSTNKTWDEELNKLLNAYNFTEVNGYTAILGNVRLWINSHPFSSFKIYNTGILPSRKTQYKAIRKLNHDIVMEKLKGVKG